MNHGNLEKGAWWAGLGVLERRKISYGSLKKRQASLRHVGVTTVAVETQ
jgi:hypothetical protein